MPLPALEDDRDLLARFKRGERGALSAVFSRYVDEVTAQVRANAARGGLPMHEVEAIVHDVFVKAFAVDARDRYDGLRPYGAWLNTITRNILIDRARKERRLRFLAPDEFADLKGDADSAFDDVSNDELRALLERFRGDMGDDERALFVVRFEEGCSLKESAVRLGISEIKARKLDTAVRMRLLERARGAGFFQHIKIKIGQSLLGRSARARNTNTDRASATST